MASNKKTASAPKKAPAILKGTAAPAKAAETAPTKAAEAAPTKPTDAPAKTSDAAPATDAAAPAKTENSDASAAPKNYSRGEGQKPVTQAYKDNWNAIFGNDNKKKKKR
jgi:hypothetical protein